MARAQWVIEGKRVANCRSGPKNRGFSVGGAGNFTRARVSKTPSQAYPGAMPGAGDRRLRGPLPRTPNLKGSAPGRSRTGVASGVTNSSRMATLSISNPYAHASIYGASTRLEMLDAWFRARWTEGADVRGDRSNLPHISASRETLTRSQIFIRLGILPISLCYGLAARLLIVFTRDSPRKPGFRLRSLCISGRSVFRLRTSGTRPRQRLWGFAVALEIFCSGFGARR